MTPFTPAAQKILDALVTHEILYENDGDYLPVKFKILADNLNAVARELGLEGDVSAALREALEPFAAVAEHDIGEDEADGDVFRPMDGFNRAPRLTVGDLRRACTALACPGTPVAPTP